LGLLGVWDLAEEEWFVSPHERATGNAVVDFCEHLLRKEKLLRSEFRGDLKPEYIRQAVQPRWDKKLPSIAENIDRKNMLLYDDLVPESLKSPKKLRRNKRGSIVTDDDGTATSLSKSSTYVFRSMVTFRGDKPLRERRSWHGLEVPG